MSPQDFNKGKRGRVEAHDELFRPKLTPFELLQRLSQFPQKESILESQHILPESTTSFRPIEPYVPSSKNDRYAEFIKRFNDLPVLTSKEVSTLKKPRLNLVQPKIRHGEYDDNFMNHSYHSSTNYSRLDYKPSNTPNKQTSDTIEEKNRIDSIEKEDDNHSYGTQDMVLDNEDDGSIVLDTQKISDLRKTLDEQLDREGLLIHETQPLFHSPQISHLNHHVASSIQQEDQLRTTRSVHSGFNPYDSITPVHSNLLPADKIINSINTQDKGKKKAEFTPENTVKPNHDFSVADDDNRIPVDTDWGDDGYGWSDNEDCISDTNNQPHTRILPGTFEIKDNYTGDYGDILKSVNKSKVMALFSNKIDGGLKINVTRDYLYKIKNMYFDQLIKDIEAYKNHRSDDTTVTNQDIILLMKRQRLLNDKTNIEKLAKDYLPREYSDLLCISALKDNETFPPDE